MSRVVLDASALLAIINGEPGAEKLTPQLLQSSTSSTVNLAEVQGKLVSRGIDPGDAWEASRCIIRDSEPFTDEQARIAGTLVRDTSSLGLSLGDRACLALGISLGAPVYTADRSWKGLKLGIKVHVVR